eukprot:TRINITY_DN8700_c1_g1_i2.p1 TRINITY_DN8700_c1_g1~~TRINITY_DN8700_c1_g1_i2.p1  ORF type:complete len:394 (+),score=38.21 TRINITY_DN8700_c1_g1_i2:73-1254(+)
MEPCRDAVPVLKCVPGSNASNQRYGKRHGANRVETVDELENAWSTTCCEIGFEDDHYEDDASISSFSDFGIDDVVSAQMTVRAPEGAKPTCPRPVVGIQFHGQQAKSRRYAQHASNSLVNSEAKAVVSQQVSDMVDHGASSMVSAKLADATVSVACTEESSDARPRLRPRKLDPLVFRSSPASTGVCTNPTKGTSPSEGDAMSVEISDEAGSRSINRAKSIVVGIGGRHLCAGPFSSGPTKPTCMKLAKLHGDRFASSRGTNTPASSRSQARSSPPSEVVLLQKANSSGSGVAYNLVQFKASPSLSTTQDAGRRAQSISAPTTKRDEGEDSKVSKIFAKLKTRGILKQTFSGWSKNEVKAALQGNYSPEEIADVLEALGQKSPKLSAKKFASA